MQTISLHQSREYALSAPCIFGVLIRQDHLDKSRYEDDQGGYRAIGFASRGPAKLRRILRQPPKDENSFPYPRISFLIVGIGLGAIGGLRAAPLVDTGESTRVRKQES